jgi:hypothetical protein
VQHVVRKNRILDGAIDYQRHEYLRGLSRGEYRLGGAQPLLLDSEEFDRVFELRMAARLIM